jgi:hypothetical protein
MRWNLRWRIVVRLVNLRRASTSVHFRKKSNTSSNSALNMKGDGESRWFNEFSIFSAQSHDIVAVRDAFLFDSTRLYPDTASWAFQTMQMLRELGLFVTVSNHVDLLERVNSNLTDVDQVCFDHVATSSEKTLSFFRLFRDVDMARSFRAFLSSQSEETQNFLLLFFTSGFRWRFFTRSNRGSCCPACRARFWSWEHFFSCSRVTGVTLVPRIRHMVDMAAWGDICRTTRVVTTRWKQAFTHDSLSEYVQGLWVFLTVLIL